MREISTPSVILLSGGLDSALCLAMTRPEYALAIDYGQPNATKEIACAERLARAYSAKLTVASIEMPSAPSPDDPAMLWPGRNLVLLSLAAALAQQIGASAVIIGANADDSAGYPDCRPEFFAAAEPALGITVLTPLLDKTKAEIGALARERGVPLLETWSCYYPVDGAACNLCDACTGRERALA
jgi:7-cyano-7-deazaguanine synthase